MRPLLKQPVRLQKRSFARKNASVALSLVLACAMCLPLVSCKDTDVLTEKIIDQSAPVVDESLTPIREPDANAEEDHDKDETKQEDDKQDEVVPETPTYDDQTSAEEEATDYKHSESFGQADAAISGDEQGESESAGDGAGDSGSGTGAGDEASAADGDTEGDGDAPSAGSVESEDGENLAAGTSSSNEDPEGGNGTGLGTLVSVLSDLPDEGDSSQSNVDSSGDSVKPGNTPGQNSESTSGSGGAAQIVVPENGMYKRLPKAGKIAAAGQYAAIVQMIGGKGALAACDSQWLAVARAKGAFTSNGDELGNVQVAWSGDGSAAGSANLQAIVDSGADTVLTSASYGGLSQADAEALMNAGLNVVEMPVVGVTDARDSSILLAVDVVGQLLADAGTSVNGNDSLRMAQLYKNFHNTVLENTLNANGGKYALAMRRGHTYGNKLYQIPRTDVSNVKVADYVTAIVDSWRTSADLNGQTVTTSGRQHGDWQTWPIPYSPVGSGGGGIHTVTIDCSGGVGWSFVNSGLVDSYSYPVADYYLQHADCMDTSMWLSSSCESPGEAIDTSSLYYLYRSYNGAGLVNPYVTIGDDCYPSLLARDASIAANIQVSSRIQHSQYYVGEYNYGQPYETWIVPSGVTGSWLDGTVESFFIAPWYTSMVHGKDMASCTSYIDDFYQLFFRCEGRAALSSYYGYGDADSVVACS